MKIVILDGFTSNPGDLSWDDIKSLGDTPVWPRTSTGDFSQRAKNADVLVVNKFILGKNEFKQVPRLKLVCTLATGYNNVDIDYCNAHGITVCNAVGYSSQSVAQHVFAMILHHYNNANHYMNDVSSGKWTSSIDWTFYTHFLGELSGKSVGIYGYGKIGK